MLISLIIAIIVAGILAFLIDKAPFIDGEYKAFAKYALLVIVVIYILTCLFGGPGYYFPSPNFRR